MQTIFKYEVKEGVQIPQGYNILDIQTKDSVIYLWAIVDTEQPLVELDLKIIGTGWDLSLHNLNGYEYFRTVQEGFYVWHIFKPL